MIEIYGTTTRDRGAFALRIARESGLHANGAAMPEPWSVSTKGRPGIQGVPV